MKLKSHEQEIVNDFFRNYVDSMFKNPMNVVRLNPGHTEEHRRAIFECCNALMSAGVPFWTEVRLKCGCIPDIVCPTHVKPIIEVLCSETIKMFTELKLDKYPEELHGSFIFVDAKEVFTEEMIW